jgi:hypothetical protein
MPEDRGADARALRVRDEIYEPLNDLLSRLNQDHSDDAAANALAVLLDRPADALERPAQAAAPSEKARCYGRSGDHSWMAHDWNHRGVCSRCGLTKDSLRKAHAPSPAPSDTRCRCGKDSPSLCAEGENCCWPTRPPSPTRTEKP